MAKEVQNSRSGEAKKTAKDLDEFMNNVRNFFSVSSCQKGTRVSKDEILGVAKLFNDELTLDNINSDLHYICGLVCASNTRVLVTWLEHMKVEDRPVHPIINQFVSSGVAFGAERWLAVLQRQCERLEMQLIWVLMR
ncbi:hypothetical protein POM88_011440 [Heracleum sosnowskyi]|uniref:START domain-containing protein n=1 Tax=Heracleum sosnowskyi TaxID=360622 RepID=A0AAD8IW89_9APIA|nr:hypothetical protein POM88_011440 [Heracleum sosnowskyi]